GGEAGGGGAVDDAVVVAQRQRQDQARLELLAIPYRARVGARDAEDGDLRGVDDRRELGPADAAQRADREAAAAHLRRAQLALAGLGGELAGLGGDLHHALGVAVADDRDHQAVWR